MAKAKSKSTTKPKARPHGRAPLDVSARNLKSLVAKHQAARVRLRRLNAVAEKKLAATGIATPIPFDRAEYMRQQGLAFAVTCGAHPFRRATYKVIKDLIRELADAKEADHRKWLRDYNAEARRIHNAVGATAALNRYNVLYVECTKAAKAFFSARAGTLADVRIKADALVDLYAEWFSEFDGETWTGYIARDLAKFGAAKV